MWGVMSQESNSMNYARHLLASACFTLAISSAAMANNNFFLPGDAFFPTELTADDLSRLKADADNPYVFKYSNCGGYEMAFCGNAGYNRARIPGLNKAFVANLKKAYFRIRGYEDRQLVEHKDDDGKTTLIETNGMRVLFYPQFFQIPKFKIGLRYNDNWVTEVVKFRHSSRHIRLCCLVNDKDAVMESWRDSTDVAPLDVSLPKINLKQVLRTNAPVTINGRLKAIVLDSRPLTKYFHPEDFVTSVLVVDSTGIIEVAYVDGKWVTEKDDD